MKFELFQQHPAVEYEPHLDRVSRQLRDIKEKVRPLKNLHLWSKVTNDCKKKTRKLSLNISSTQVRSQIIYNITNSKKTP